MKNKILALSIALGIGLSCLTALAQPDLNLVTYDSSVCQGSGRMDETNANVARIIVLEITNQFSQEVETFCNVILETGRHRGENRAYATTKEICDQLQERVKNGNVTDVIFSSRRDHLCAY